MQRFFVILASFFVQGALVAGDGGWSYDHDTGPSRWPKMFLTCDGSRQSPINIESANVKQEYWKPLVFKNFDAVPTRMRVKNNGHAAQVEIDAPRAPRLGGGGLKGEYIFTQFHFHWGANSGQGSEHTIDGVRYPMEMHMVHYKASYVTLTEAIKHPDGLAVIGVLFEVGPRDNPSFTPLIDSLANIKKSSKVSEVQASYALNAYMPSNKDSFYRYLGSLTTPTCGEIVIWTVFKEAVMISERQLDAFRQLNNDHGSPIVDNFRPPQQIRSRRVYMSMSESGADSTSTKKLGLALYFMSTMAVLMMNM